MLRSTCLILNKPRYQAGESIYDLFDKVLIIDQGRQVFYGPPAEARAYFENLGYASLPRQSTADYLTGCTDPNERRFQPGRSTRDTPASPDALETAFIKSHYNQSNVDAVEKYKLHMETEKTDQEAFRAAVIADKKKGVSKKSPYTLGISGQVWALTVRNFQQKLQDKFQIYTSFTLSWVSSCLCSCRGNVLSFSQILALVIGSAYFNQTLTSSGAFTRGSVVFAALLTTCLDAFGEVMSHLPFLSATYSEMVFYIFILQMPLQMLGRPILRKQVRPSRMASIYHCN